MTNIAVLVSGGGTNLQALIDAEEAGKIENGGIRLVVSSNPNAFALERAAKAGIETAVLRRKEYDSAERYGEALDALLREKEEEWTEFTAAVDRVLRGGGCLGSA